MARAAEKVADKAKAIVAHQLEADPADIELRDGKWIVRGSPEKGMALADVAGAAYVPENLPDGMEPGLDETAFYDPENFVFPFGAHACVVDVDGETGKIQVVRYVAVDDCGPPINPLLIDGQVHGGITQALGQALYEQVHYDEDGQLVTGSFVDYALPTAAELPSYETRPHRDAVTGQLARRQGRRRGGHDRRVGYGDQCRDRCAAPARSDLPGHAAHAHEGLDGHQRGEGRVPVIPPEFDYVAPDTLDEALQALSEGGEDAKVAGRRPLAPAAHEAAPGRADAARGPAQGPGAAGRAARERPVAHRRDDASRRHAGQRRPGPGRARRRRSSPTSRSATAGPSAARWSTAIRPPTCPPCSWPARARSRSSASGGTREVAAVDMFEDYLTTAVGEGEIVTEIRVPSFDGWGSSYLKFTRRAEDWAMVGVLAMVKKAGDGSVEDVRIALTNMGSTPLRATAAEDALRGKGLDAIAAAAEQAAEGTDPPGDLNATPDYKRHLARVLTRRALEEAAA